MKCIRATGIEIQRILDVLDNAKKRLSSENFLVGFPIESTKWFKCRLKETNLGDLYLFWDGIAWDESGDVPPRILKDGVKDFKRIGNNPIHDNPEILNDIFKRMNQLKLGEMPSGETFPILVSNNESNPLLILDGNHRLAAFWWKNFKIDRKAIDRIFWIGYSPDMKDYYYYRRILSTSSR